MSRFSLRALLLWLGPSAGVGTLTAQTRSPARDGGIVVDTLASVTSRHLGTPRTVRVYLPRGYATSSDRYPVLYANDGQDMDAVGLVGSLDSLVKAGLIEPLIVVAVHSTSERLQEYGIAGQANAQGLGSRAGAYENFIVGELMPLVERRYRARRGPAHTAIMGWSLGGLSAFDLAWRRSDKFGSIGAFSGSFWWRTDDGSAEARQSSRITHRRIRETASAPRLRIWLEAGRQDEKDDRDMNGVIDAIQDTRELVDELVRKGMREGEGVRYHEMHGGHNPETWGKALPLFLTWAFGTKPR